MYLARPSLLLPPLLLIARSIALVVPNEQQALHNPLPGSVSSVRSALKKAEIIPTVIDDFIPSLSLDVAWPSNKTAMLGNVIKPKKVQDAPNIELYDESTTAPGAPCKQNMQYTVALTDPDAPSRDNPKWSEMCHWIATNVPLTTSGVECDQAVDNLQGSPMLDTRGLEDIIEYKPPGPPPKTGKHRYVFLVFAPKNSTSMPLNLTKPDDRQHWGGEEGHGVQDWAKENGLVPVAANFIYSMNKKQ